MFPTLCPQTHRPCFLVEATILSVPEEQRPLSPSHLHRPAFSLRTCQSITKSLLFNSKHLYKAIYRIHWVPHPQEFALGQQQRRRPMKTGGRSVGVNDWLLNSAENLCPFEKNIYKVKWNKNKNKTKHHAGLKLHNLQPLCLCLSLLFSTYNPAKEQSLIQREN